MDSISSRLLQVRQTLKKTLKDVEIDTGVNDSHYSFMEHDKRKVTVRTVKAICSVYNVNEVWLRTGEGAMFASAPVMQTPEKVALLEKFRRFPPALQDATLRFCDSLLATLDGEREETK